MTADLASRLQLFLDTDLVLTLMKKTSRKRHVTHNPRPTLCNRAEERKKERKKNPRYSIHTTYTCRRTRLDLTECLKITHAVSISAIFHSRILAECRQRLLGNQIRVMKCSRQKHCQNVYTLKGEKRCTVAMDRW